MGEMTPRRKKRLTQLALQRQLDLVVILENVHDPHNIGAVMRTCDSIGVGEVHVIYTEERTTIENIKLGKRSSAGTRKWVDVYLYRDIDSCIDKFKGSHQVLGAYMEESSPELYSLQLYRPTALVFGNEHDGISDELKSRLDGTFFIPQVGMVQSLNISVACAVTLYEAYRQRATRGDYKNKNESDRKALIDTYFERADSREHGIEPNLEF